MWGSLGEEYYVEESEDGDALLELVTTDGNGRVTKYLKNGENLDLGTLDLSFNKEAIGSNSIVITVP